MGMVYRGGQIYASDEAVSRRRGQRRRNRRMLEEVVAINDAGQQFTLAELADTGQANPALRRGELMVRIRGTEEVAEAAGHLAAFVTVTAPSRFHAVHQSGEVNPKWDGSQPRDAHHHLRRVWERTRAAWHRAGLAPYGLRVAEPHHDGTPHWHLLLFVPADNAREAVAMLREQAMAEAPDEPGADRHRCKTEWIDPERGSAAGYVAKYVAKNIDAHGLERDLYGTDAAEAVDRIDAWAANWGIRQFQFFGLPPVGLWRELRRLDGAPAGPLGDAYAAADAGNWRRFAEVVAEHPTIRLAKEDGGTNKYGERRQPQPVGVTYAGTHHRTRRRIWATGRAGEAARPAYPTRPPRPDGGAAWNAAIHRLRDRQRWGRSMDSLRAAINYAREAKDGTGADGQPEHGNGGSHPGVAGRVSAGSGYPQDQKGRGLDRGASLAGGRWGSVGRAGLGPGGVGVAGGAAAGPWTGVNNCTQGETDGRGSESEAGEQGQRAGEVAGRPPGPDGGAAAAEVQATVARPGGRGGGASPAPSGNRARRREGRGGLTNAKSGNR
jgi:hypothetical protein